MAESPVSIMKVRPGQGVLCLTQPLGTLLTLLGDGPFQEPQVTDPVWGARLGAISQWLGPGPAAVLGSQQPS